MPKAKKSSRKMRFDYNKDRKKLKKKMMKKNNPRIEHPQIRGAWDNNKSMARNLREMGLTFDPNHSLSQQKAGGELTVIKPYILHQLQQEADQPEKDTKTLSSDLMEYVQHMIRHHGDDLKVLNPQGKPTTAVQTLRPNTGVHIGLTGCLISWFLQAMARDEKNYYQDTPKQIGRKIKEYRRCHPQHYQDFMSSLKATEPLSQPMVQ